MEIHGPAVHQYEGQGTVVVTAGRIYPCSFTAVQTNTGSILFQLHVSIERKQLMHAGQDFAFGQSLQRIEGTTKDGHIILSDQDLRLTRIVPGTNAFGLTLFANRLRVTNQPNPIQRVRFAFLNFDFVGNESQRQGRIESLSLLRVRFPNTELVFEQIVDYDEVVERIKAQHSVDVTSEVEFQLIDGFSHEDALQVADDLHLLLSFARGRFVNWVYYTAFDGNDNTVFTEHQARYMRPWPTRSLTLIDNRNLEDTTRFLEQAYPRLQDLKQEFVQNSQEDEVKKIFRMHIDACTTGFIGTGALTAVSLLDFLRNRWLNRNEKPKIISKCQFKRVRRKVITTLEEEKLESKKLEDMKIKIPELNRPPMFSSYKEFLGSPQIGISVEDGDVREFVNTRNDLVHNGSFHSVDRKGMTKEYFAVINLLDKVLLRLLGYKGHYINCSNNFNREEFQ